MKPLPHSFCDPHSVKCELASTVLRSSGKLRLQVTGWSMLPSILPGDTLVVESTKKSTVSEGDIVLFGRDRRLFAHRLVAKSDGPLNSEILTRGDAMPQPDPPVGEHELLGRVSHVVRNGRYIEPSRKPGISQRAVAALVRRSQIAARVVVRMHGLRQTADDQV
jgi:signal peptidase I